MAKRYEYQVIEKQSLGKRGIENMLPSLGADGFAFAFETHISYVFCRELVDGKVEEAPKRTTKKPASQ